MLKRMFLLLKISNLENKKVKLLRKLSIAQNISYKKRHVTECM